MTERPIRYIPRWLHYQADVTEDLAGWLFTEIPPNAFANDTIWPFRLDYLAITGLPPWSNRQEFGVAGQFWGGLGSCTYVELGISGVSDINQVPIVAGAAMPHKKRFIKGPNGEQGMKIPYLDDALFARFKYPYLLAMGNGLSVTFSNSRDDFQYDGENEYKGIPAFVAHGYGASTGNPVMLAGSYRQTDRPGVFPVIKGGSGVSLSGADLVNNGREDVVIDRIGMTFPYAEENVAHTVVPDAPIVTPFMSLYGLYSNYLINPINGPKWMPGSNPVPVMGICPYDYPWPLAGLALPFIPTAQVPCVYEFPQDTVLLRRQRLSVKLTNGAFTSRTQSEEQQPVCVPIRANVTLFGYLEVR